MRIGIAGPVTLSMLATHVRNGDTLPEGYPFPSMAPYVEALIRRGHQISIFTLAPNLSKPLFFEGENLRIQIGRMRAGGRARDLFAFERQELIEAMRSDPVDVLHAQWTYEFALAALHMPTPTLVTARDAPLNILRYSPDAYRLIRFFLAAQVSRKTQHLTAVSAYIQRHFQQVFGFRRAVEVIPNGIPDRVFDLYQPGGHKQQPKLVFAAILTGWSRFKNCTALLQAFSLVQRQLPESELWLFGTGHGPGEQAHLYAQSRKLTENVVFHGRTPYETLLQQMASKVDVLVHPALEESFSMAVAEGMALGIPVVGGHRSGAVPDTLGSGGLLVDVRKPEAIANGMLRLAQDQALRSELGLLGRQKALTQFSLSKVTDAYERLYQRVLESREPSRSTLSGGAEW